MSNVKQGMIICSSIIIIFIYAAFFSPSSIEFVKNKQKLKENYGIARGVLLYYRVGGVGGHGFFEYKFCVDSAAYFNRVSLKYLKKITEKVGDTISIAYQLDSIENNKPMYELFRDDSIGNKYKYEFE